MARAGELIFSRIHYSSGFSIIPNSKFIRISLIRLFSRDGVNQFLVGPTPLGFQHLISSSSSFTGGKRKLDVTAAFSLRICLYLVLDSPSFWEKDVPSAYFIPALVGSSHYPSRSIPAKPDSGL